METMYWFILLICSEAIVSFGDNTESVAEKQTESKKQISYILFWYADFHILLGIISK